MNKSLIISLIWVLFLGTFACKPKPELIPETPLPPKKENQIPSKNVILLIGNGMGLAHITAGMYRSPEPLNIQKFPFTGVHKPNIGNKLVADSLAVAVAIARGLNLVGAADTIAAKSVLIQAKKKGRAVGIITDTEISGAISTAFIGHKNSGAPSEIVADLFKKKLDLFIGKNSSNFEEVSEKEDYQIAKLTEKNVGNLSYENERKFIGLLNEKSDFPSKNIQPTLNFLKSQSEKGFFLVIENSKIRAASYQNNGEKIAAEIINFDKTIGEVLKFAEKNKNTLVVLTSNQEAGGFSLNSGTTRDTIYGAFTTQKNTGILLPVFAYGPNADSFEGVYENTAIFSKIKEAFLNNER